MSEQQEFVFEDKDLAIHPEDFKELKPDLWIEIAVRQCLANGVTDEEKYYLSVENLESTMVTKLDAEYEADIAKAFNELSGKVPDDIKYIKLAPKKFKALMKLIDRKKPKEATLEL